MRIDELMKLIKDRRSIREYSPEEIDDTTVNILLDAARYAPNNSNRQAWKFVILTSKEKRLRIIEEIKKECAKITDIIDDLETKKVFIEYAKYFTFFENAPAIIFALYKRTPSVIGHIVKRTAIDNNGNYNSSELISVSMAVQNILLAAHALGLGACCTTGPLFVSDKIKKILDIRPPFEIAAIIPIGKYTKPVSATGRKDIAKISEFIR